MELFDSDTDDTNGDEPPRQRRRIVTVNDSDDDDDEDDDDDDGVDSSGDGDTVMTISAQDLLNSMFSSSGGGADDDDEVNIDEDDDDEIGSRGTGIGSLNILRYLLRSGQVRLTSAIGGFEREEDELPPPGSHKLVNRFEEDVSNFLDFQHQLHADVDCCPRVNLSNKKRPSRSSVSSDSKSSCALTPAHATSPSSPTVQSTSSSDSSSLASTSAISQDSSNTEEEKQKEEALPDSAVLWSKSLKRSTFKLLRNREVFTTRNLAGRRKAAVLRGRVPNKLVSSFSYHEHNSRLFCAKFSMDGATFCSASQSGISIVDTETWRQIKYVSDDDTGWSIIDTDYSPRSNLLAYSKWSDDVHVVNTYGTHQLHDPHRILNEPGRSCIFGVKFSPNNVHLLCGASHGHVVVYDMTTKKPISYIRRAHDDDINSVTYLDDSPFLYVTGSDDSIIKVWDTRTSTKSRDSVGAFIGHEQGLSCVATKGDGRFVLSNGKDHCMKLWDMRKISNLSAVQDSSRRPRSFFDYRNSNWQRGRYPRMKDDHSIMSYSGHKVRQTLIRCNFSPLHSTGQSYVITGSADSEIVVYDALSGEVVRRLSGHGDSVIRDVTWHPDRPEICGASWSGAVLRFVYDEGRDCIHLGPARGKLRVHEDDGSFGRGSMAARRRRRREAEESKTAPDSSSTTASSSPIPQAARRTCLCTEEWGARGTRDPSRMDSVRFTDAWF